MVYYDNMHDDDDANDDADYDDDDDEYVDSNMWPFYDNYIV